MADDPVDQLLQTLLAPPHRGDRTALANGTSIAAILRRALLDMHVQNSKKAINYPARHGAFPGNLLAVIPPVVPDANTLRNDIRYACRHDQRTVLVNAANAGLLRLFCSQHVIEEVVEHSEEWTADGAVSHSAFLRRWVVEYLPMVRVLRDTDVPERLLTSDERARVDVLRRQDSDDVPSARLALALGAFYLSNDHNALAAVYGPGVDFAAHEQWLECLMAGGDAGELGQMLQLAMAVGFALGRAAVRATQNLWRWGGPLGFLPLAAMAYFVQTRMRPEARSKLRAGALTALGAAVEIYGEYQNLLLRFRRAAPDLPSWDVMSETIDPPDLLTRACLFTLARVGMSNCSAADVRPLLPDLPVPHGEAKVRQVLRSEDCFSEAWAGRWQVGTIAPLLADVLARPMWAER